MKLNELIKLRQKHKEEILDLLSDEDHSFLKETCDFVYKKNGNYWLNWTKGEHEYKNYHDYDGEIFVLREASIILHDYVDMLSRTYYKINPDFYYNLIKRYNLNDEI